MHKLLIYRIAILISTLILVLGCTPVKYIQLENSTVIKDSIVVVKDTITVEIPTETATNIVPKDTTSLLKTSNAESSAKITDGKLHHTLKQTGNIKVLIDTCYITKQVQQVKYYPKEIIKEIKHIPNWAYYSLLLNIAIIAITGTRIILKLKRKL